MNAQLRSAWALNVENADLCQGMLSSGDGRYCPTGVLINTALEMGLIKGAWFDCQDSDVETEEMFYLDGFDYIAGTKMGECHGLGELARRLNMDYSVIGDMIEYNDVAGLDAEEISWKIKELPVLD